jgi:PAS domain S-box-containing protein
MVDFFTQLFDSDGFFPRWQCGDWSAGLGWLHIFADLGVWSAYLAIPLVLTYFATHRKDLPFQRIFWLFGAFILACGTTHLMDATLFWWPAYRLAVLIKLGTAVVSWGTVVALIPIVPRALAMRNAEELAQQLRRRAGELAQANAALKRESDERLRAQEHTRQLNQQLVARVNELETLLEVIPIGIGIAEDPACQRIRANATLARLLALEPGANASLSAPEPDRPRSYRVLQGGRELAPAELPLQRSATEGIAVREVELTIERDDGVRRALLGYSAPLCDPHGKPRGSVGAFVDVTDRLIAQEQLRQSERHFRELAEGLPQLVFIARADGSRDYLSRQWCAYTGRPEAEHLGWGWIELIHPDDRDSAVAAWRQAVATGSVYEGEYRLRRADGYYRWFTSRAVPFRDERGVVVKWFGTKTDIDDRKRAEEALRDVSQRKDQFLATLAHELRNPLAPLRNALYMMKLSPHNPRVTEESRELMERQLRVLVRLIDDLLDLSRISRGKVQLQTQRVELDAVIGHAVETSRPHLDAAAVSLEVSLPAVPLFVMADVDRLTQVISNLLNNAAKFTPAGGSVIVRVSEEKNTAVVSVRDTGVGIPHEQLPRLFEMYSQVGPGGTHGGLGIGLALVRGLVELHGGTVTASSDGPNMGSEFVIRLPHCPEDGARRPKKPTARDDSAAIHAASLPKAKRVLVVDDNRDSAESLAKLLQLIGYQVRLAYDGPQALDEARSFLPQIVLLDIGMPGMSGHAVAQAIRAEGPPLGVALLVAMTGWGHERDRQRSREAGFNAHLVKPVELNDLLPLLAHID